jgi:ABC-2 type transport system permease protein
MRIWYVARREMIQLLRDRRTVFAFLAVPIALVALFGYALSFNVRHLRTAVLDEDRSPASQRLLDAFVQSGRFDVTEAVLSEEELGRALDTGICQVGIRIPPRYSQDLARGREVPVLIVVDGSDPQMANTAVNYGRAILGAHSTRLAAAALAQTPAGATIQPQPLDGRIRVWYNPELRDPIFMIPGVVGIITAGLTMVLTAFAVVREREQGTYEQLIVTPLRPAEIIYGKLLPYVLMASINAALIIGSGCLFFDVPIRGSVALLAGLTLVFILGSLGIGLLISTVSQTQSQVFPVIVMNYLPNLLLSGFIFPINAMPEPVQPLTQLIPLTHYLTIVRGIMLKGLGIEALMPQVIYLAAFCLGILTLSSLLLRKKLA